MKITRNQLKSLIKEEMNRTFRAPVAAMEESEHAHQTLVSKEPPGGEQPTWEDVEDAWTEGWYNGGDAGSDIGKAWLNSNAKRQIDNATVEKEDTTPAY
tara:strand:- start:450 stop:746 length:297 start_codon:yes stop_codon:yes gene_type:complete